MIIGPAQWPAASLATRLGSRHRGRPDEPFYSQLANAIDEDRVALDEEGKLALWKSLKAAAAHDGGLRAAADFDELITRAQSQLDGLEQRRLGAAAGLLRSETETA